MNAAHSSHLAPEAISALEVPLQATKTVRCAHTKDFLNLHERQELQGIEDQGKSVDLFLCNPPYNVRRQQDMRKSNHDVFIAKDMDEFCDFSDHVQNHGVHGLIFCSAVPFAPDGGFYPLAWKRLRRALGNWKCLRWSKCRCFIVVSTALISKTACWSTWDTQTWWNMQFISCVLKWRSILCSEAFATTRPAT